MSAASKPSRKAAVLGWPVAHSLSPLIHNYWLKQYGIEGEYLRMAVEPDNLATVLKTLPLLDMAGANLTVPHKERALALVDEVDAEAKAIGAVNTIIVKNGKLFGSNTDAFGFSENLKAHDAWPEGKEVVIIGAGGAARAAIHALKKIAKTITILNRTEERGASLAAELRADFKPWNQRNEVIANVDLLVNTTTQGMKGQAPLDIDLAALKPAAIVYDIVYNPLETPLLADARNRGNKIVDGLGMLIHQARPAFAAWFGVMPEATPELRKLLEAHL